MNSFSRICFKNVCWVRFHLPGTIIGARDTVVNKRNKVSALMELICLCKTHPFLFRGGGWGGAGHLPLAKQFICSILFSLQFLGGNFQIFRKVERITLWIVRYPCLNSSIVNIILSLFFSICYIYTHTHTHTYTHHTCPKPFESKLQVSWYYTSVL